MASELIKHAPSFECPSSVGDSQLYEHDVAEEEQGNTDSIYKILEGIMEAHLNMFPLFPYGVFDEGKVREWVLAQWSSEAEKAQYSEMDQDGLRGIYDNACWYHEKAEELSGKITEIVSGLQGLAETEIERDFDAIYDDIMRRIGDMSSRSLNAARGELKLQAARIFPGRAEVHTPDGCKVSIPTVRRWKRDKGIAGLDEACDAYVVITREAKRELLAAIDGAPLPEITIKPEVIQGSLEVPEDTFSVKLHELLEGFVACVNDEEIRDVEDRLVAQIKWADKILEHLKSHRPMGQWLVDKCVEREVSRHEPMVTGVVRFAVEGEFSRALQEALKRVQRKLDEYQPLDHAAEARGKPGATPKRPKRARQQSATAEASDVQPREVREITLRPGNKLPVDKGQFPWLEGEDDDRSVIIAMQGADHNVAVLDMRTSKVLGIWHETKEARQEASSIIDTKLQFIAQSVADGDVLLSMLKRVYGPKKKYPFPILYWSEAASDALRLYVTRVNVANMLDGRMKQQLMDGNVNELLLYLGACDKHRQVELLQQFTGHDRRRLVGRGAGSI